MRYFAGQDDIGYETIRTTLDAAWGLPNDLGTDTCLPPANVAPRNQSGLITLALRDEFCEWQPASAMLPELLDVGVIAEISADEYRAGISKPGP
jgi:hypothetical protein